MGDPPRKMRMCSLREETSCTVLSTFLLTVDACWVMDLKPHDKCPASGCPASVEVFLVPRASQLLRRPSSHQLSSPGPWLTLGAETALSQMKRFPWSFGHLQWSWECGFKFPPYPEPSPSLSGTSLKRSPQTWTPTPEWSAPSTKGKLATSFVVILCRLHYHSLRLHSTFWQSSHTTLSHWLFCQLKPQSLLHQFCILTNDIRIPVTCYI